MDKKFFDQLKKYCEEAVYIAEMHIAAGETSFSGIREVLKDITTIITNKEKEL